MTTDRPPIELSNSRLVRLQCPFSFWMEFYNGMKQPLSEPLIRGRLGHAIIEDYIDHLKRVRMRRDLETLAEIAERHCMQQDRHAGLASTYRPSKMCGTVMDTVLNFGRYFELMKKAVSHHSEMVIIIDRNGGAWSVPSWQAAGFKPYDHDKHCVPDPPFDLVSGILDYVCRERPETASITDFKLGFQKADFGEAEISQQLMLYAGMLFLLWEELDEVTVWLRAPKYGRLNNSYFTYSRELAVEQAMQRIERGFNVLDTCWGLGAWPHRDENIDTCWYCPCPEHCPGCQNTIDEVMQFPAYRWNSRTWNEIPIRRKG